MSKESLSMRRVPRSIVVLLCLTLAACGARNASAPSVPAPVSDLHPGETPEMRRLVQEYARIHGIPEALLHRVIQRESGYNPGARNGPYWGLMQIAPETARTMGYDGPPSGLLDAETNLNFAGRYLRGAWLVSNGDMDAAVGWYARGYYYEARNRCLLVETGLRASEVARHCRT